MSRGSDPPTVIPLTVAQLLGKELMALTRDDGARLAEIIAELRHGVRVEPGNLIAVNALVHALAYAGEAQEAHALAWRAYTLMQQLPVVGADTLLNVGAGLSEAEHVDEAKRCYELALVRAEDDIAASVAGNMMNLAVRFGELAWLERFFPEHPVPAFLRRHDLAAGWRGQQKAVEQILDSRVSSFHASHGPFHDGTERLVVDYFTSIIDPQLAELEEAVWSAVEHHHRDHQRGPGALLGVVIINVNGPEIPSPKNS